MLLREVICIVEIIGGVKLVVTYKIESTSVQGIGTRTRNCVDYAARSEAVLRGIVAREYGELLNSIHTQVLTEFAAGACVGIIIHDRPVQAITVLRGPAP